MKFALINIAALICAIAFFSGTIVYSASELPVVDTSIETVKEDDFNVEDDLLLGDLLDKQASSQQSSSSKFLSSQHSSKETISSEKESLKPVASSKPKQSVPSKTPSTSVESKEESKEPSSSVESKEESKEPPSSTESKEESKPPQSSSEQVIEIEIPESSSSEEESSQDEVEVDNPELLDILAGAVQREIIGTNTQPSPKYYEAYKAQAVASHTYMEHHKERTGSYPKMSYSTPKQKTIDLVAEVLNELIYYNGSLINASYHAASGGYTQGSNYVWSSSIPYLVGVESKYDDYIKTSTVSISQVEDRLQSHGILTDGDPESWFELSEASLTDGGFVDYMSICGQSVRGRTLRENILGTNILKSAKIIDIEVSGNNFIFTTKGYGHGVGFSQQGARGYSANEGWDYITILTHYYTGVNIS